jgi:hypothetical protein
MFPNAWRIKQNPSLGLPQNEQAFIRRAPRRTETRPREAAPRVKRVELDRPAPSWSGVAHRLWGLYLNPGAEGRVLRGHATGIAAGVGAMWTPAFANTFSLLSTLPIPRSRMVPAWLARSPAIGFGSLRFASAQDDGESLDP